MSGTDEVQSRHPQLTFAQLLKRLRLAADLTQEELAERADVSARLISDIERGTIKRSRRDTVQMLADGLELSGGERETFTAIARRKPPPTALIQQPSGQPRLDVPSSPIELIGREREITAITSFLNQPEVRLLTLNGPGGAGKTQLALAAAKRIASTFPDGVVFVDLAPLIRAQDVVPTIARSLDIAGRPGADRLDLVIAELQERRLLLILDNMEHVVASAPEISQLVQRCPDLTILVTSRQPLHLRAEREYSVTPLALPDLESLPDLIELSRVAGVELFVRRAEAARQGFALTQMNARSVAEIVVRLDGLPLAIELAASRIKIMSPAELLDHLQQRLPLLTGGDSDTPARQRTLRAAIDWSYDLLDHRERQLFQRLAVFTGGFGLDAVERVGPPAEAEAPQQVQVLDSLSSLVDRNLLQTLDPAEDDDQTRTRFRMLETIREYALERLSGSTDEIAARDRHAEWCVELAETAEWELIGPNQVEWFATMRREVNNVRAALTWAIETGQAEPAQRICGAIWRFWVAESQLFEARDWTSQSLAISDSVTRRSRARTLNAAGIVAHQLGDFETAESSFKEALSTYEALKDTRGVAYSLGNLGVISDVQQDYRAANERYTRALGVFREINDLSHVGFMLGNLGLIAYFQGEYERANTLLNESLENARQRSDRDSEAIVLGNLGLTATAQGEFERAEDLNAEALKIRLELPNRSHLARCFENFALNATGMGVPERAVRFFAAASALRAEIGSSLPPNDLEHHERAIRRLRSLLTGQQFSRAWEAGVLSPLDEIIGEAVRPGAQITQRDVSGPMPTS